MGNKLDIQSFLEKILGSGNVYYQPPESLKLKYPAIVYSKNRIDPKHADNVKYKRDVEYSLIVIDRRPDHPVIEKLLELPYCSYDRYYASENLNHDALTLYY